MAPLRSPLRVALRATLASLALAAAACDRSEAARSGRPAAADTAAGRGTQARGANDAPPANPEVARADSARIQGRADAPLWVVEISDFQCPYCRQWHEETYPALKREYIDAGKIRFAYLHLPLPSHAHARLAAEATMCAGAQGKFWEVHDAIFREQARWASQGDAGPIFQALAAGAGVDVPRFRRCLTERTMQGIVQEDFDRAVKAGVNSTPTFVIGGVTLSGAYPIEHFRAVIDSLTGAPRGAAPPASPTPPAPRP